MKSGIIQYTPIPVRRAIRGHIDLQSACNHIGNRDTELQLIDNQRLLYVFLQQFNLHWLVVGYAEVPYLPFLEQLLKSFCHFLRLHQSIRAMQQQCIQIVRAQSAQNSIHRGNNMLLGKIIEAFANTAFGLQE